MASKLDADVTLALLTLVQPVEQSSGMVPSTSGRTASGQPTQQQQQMHAQVGPS